MHWLCRSWCDLGKSVSDQPAVADHVVAARARAAAGLPQITPSEYVQERHQRDKTEDPPSQFSARSQVRPVGGQVDPHEDDSQGMQKTNQDLKQLLHSLNLPRPAGSVPAAGHPRCSMPPPRSRPGLMLPVLCPPPIDACGAARVNI